MSNIAIIAEYNPFHNGHKLHMEEAVRLAGEAGFPCGGSPREDHCVIAVMSGDFTQRGHAAVFSKWKRAEAAVVCGADLVLELPVWAACGGAEVFAAGGVGLLNSLGNIDFLAFGAEDDGADLEEAARILEEEDGELSAAIKKALGEGKSFAAARSEAVAATGHVKTAGLLSKPNNILGVEYLKQLIRTESVIKPLVIERKYAGYFGESDKGFAGAGFIREKMKEGLTISDLSAYIPPGAAEVFLGEVPVFNEDLFGLIVYRLVSEDKSRLSEIDGAVEGLENRAVKAAYEASDYESLVDRIKSKRYSRTAVERLMARTVLGITKEDVAAFRRSDKAYARVLAFNDHGAAYLRDLRKNENITVISNVSKEVPSNPVLERMVAADVKAADIYDLISTGRVGLEKKRHSIKVSHE